MYNPDGCFMTNAQALELFDKSESGGAASHSSMFVSYHYYKALGASHKDALSLIDLGIGINTYAELRAVGGDIEGYMRLADITDHPSEEVGKLLSAIGVAKLDGHTIDGAVFAHYLEQRHSGVEAEEVLATL